VVHPPVWQANAVEYFAFTMAPAFLWGNGEYVLAAIYNPEPEKKPLKT